MKEGIYETITKYFKFEKIKYYKVKVKIHT